MMNVNPTHGARAFAACLLSGAALLAQGTLEERLRRVEKQNAQLRDEIDALSSDVERIDLGGLVPPLSTAKRGVGQGAAKVYDVEQGLSIGGYGEFLFQQRSGRTDLADAQRAILYVGYKFDDKWVLNTEIEFEHGSTSGGAGTVSLEFGYLDYLHSDAINLRAGLLLSPMGFINQLHEPTAFLASSRPEVERRIIPSTWREMGIGSYGELGDFSYHAYVMTSLDGGGFGSSGLRGGRQRGAKSEADDWSLISRLDYVGVAGLIVGGSVSYGNSGQDNVDDASNPIPDLRTTIVEGHVDYRTGPWQFRALYARAKVQDAALFNAWTMPAQPLANVMNGYYGEVGCDVLTWLAPDADAQLTPFVRFERIDTQDRVPSNATRDPGQQDQILTVGLNYKPIPQVVVKLDFEHWDEDFDRFNVLFGYVF